ncbi:hypothetical protein SADUNF_Sadunf13G0097900 [Salix dunnii]|uniref:Signal recognition particle 14 kDa protein n=1 Tax=Salix dunnii TaxID=1413687 RepID=A0A835MV46_9ROSI|nr:hypothetical protein SADUNF_Sadunf13G0097900 [Salix dunnii]
MVLLQLDPFLNELTTLYQNSTEKGSIWVTLKRSSMKSKVQKNKMTTTGEPIEYRCLIRATDGKKTISTSVSILFIFKSSLIVPEGKDMKCYIGFDSGVFVQLLSFEVLDVRKAFGCNSSEELCLYARRGMCIEGCSSLSSAWLTVSLCFLSGKVGARDHQRFQASYATILKAHMTALKKRERKDKKKVAEGDKKEGGVKKKPKRA